MTVDESLRAAVAAEVAPLVQQVAELRAEIAALRAPAPAESALLSVREFAMRAGISTCTCRRRLADGTLPAVKIGGSIRISSSALQPSDPARVASLARRARQS